MGHKLKVAGWISVGVVAGALTTVSLQTVARGTLAPLPLEELQQLAAVFSMVKSDYVEPVDEKKLITDAISAMGALPGRIQLGGQTVIVDAVSARLPDGTLAGSLLTLDQAVRNMITFTGCSLAEAVQMASETPARILHHAAGFLRPQGWLALEVGAGAATLEARFPTVPFIWPEFVHGGDGIALASAADLRVLADQH